ncbi:phage tail terminator-like protein [Halomonas sp. I1]|uniref:phage tail terminator-like protein n=1 Tax=Halomonas sp. I1 TaxID=393536 RepID=UPI0028E03C92|nr:phage tail terminator-like protein [Halomonas sp. I1]MDT8894185.1 phage tail terminator-like protein [Halomonas sp. I1]
MNYQELVAGLVEHARAWPGPEPLEIPNCPVADHQGNWLRMVVNPGETLTAEVGSDPYPRMQGLAIFQIYALREKGWGAAYDIATRIGNHMAYQSIGDIDTLAYTPEDFGELDGWYRVNVSIPYRC